MRILPHPHCLALISLLSLACAASPVRQDTVLEDGERALKPGTVLNLEKEVIPEPELRKLLSNADYILIGESHDQLCHHMSQAVILLTMAQHQLRPAVGLEMVSTERQPVLDLFNQGEIEVPSLAEALDWQAKWGVDFSLYAAIFHAAQSFSLPVFALNIPQELFKQVLREGIPQPGDKDHGQLAPELVWIPEAQRKMLIEAYKQHHPQQENKGGAPVYEDNDGLHQFFFAQSLWDSEMAYRASEARRKTGRKVVILAGSGHVVHGWGIGHRLEHFDPEGRRLLLVPWDGESEIEEGVADAVFYCPREDGYQEH